MRIVFHRRHRILTLVLIVLAIAVWGSWLAATGRTTSYGATRPQAASSPIAEGPLIALPSSGLPSGSGWALDGVDVSAPPVTVAAKAGQTSMTMSSGPAPISTTGHQSTTSPSPALTAVSLAGIADPTIFVSRIAQTLLSYGLGTDFAARNEAIMAVAALPPLGNPTELVADLAALTPTLGAVGMSGDRSPVTFHVDQVAVSGWAAAKITQLHLAVGSFGIDVTGRQTFPQPGSGPVSMPIVLGITGACPPALIQCEIDRVFPQTVQQELDR